jgi:hypothetical protein
MAFIDPVDPSTESLLWPGRVGFCIVAIRKLSCGLLLLPLSRANGEAWAPASNYVLPGSAARTASQP